MDRWLHVGHYMEGNEEFILPVDSQVQTFGIIGVRGSGKTVTATVLAEEFCKKGLLWIAFDPISVWWGLRADKSGKPGGYPVVVFGGKHGDIPIQKDDGKRVAEVLATENVFAVIDVKVESKKFWHTFMADLALGLLDHEPQTPRHIFIEEAPEFVPQKTRVDLTQRCKEAVERLFRLGRNQGYGGTLISQRSATVDKDVLSQCENIFAMRSVGKHDHNAFLEWLIAAGQDKEMARVLIKGIASQEDGVAHFWSPHWRKEFRQLKVRERETFHPGETRKVGVALKAVEMAPIGEVVERVSKRLTRTVVQVPSGKDHEKGPQPFKSGQDPDFRPVPGIIPQPHPETVEELARLRAENSSLRNEVFRLRGEGREIAGRLEVVRRSLEPQYRALHGLFSEIGKSAGPGMDLNVWEPWLKKAGRQGCRKMLEVMLEKRRLTAVQLATLSGVPISKSTFRGYRSWLKSNGLITVEGEGADAVIELRSLS